MRYSWYRAVKAGIPTLRCAKVCLRYGVCVSGFHLNKDTWSFFRDFSIFSRQEAMHVPSPCFSPLLSSGSHPPSMPDSTDIILILSVLSLFKLLSVL